MTDESKSRDEICAVGLSIFQRGLTFGSTGNISVRLPDGGWLMTPTNASLGALDPARLSKFDAEGRLTTDAAARTEAQRLALAAYALRAAANEALAKLPPQSAWPGPAVALLGVC